MEIKKKKILVTDDNRGLVMYLSNVLNRLGFQVIPAVDGHEVEKLMSLMSPDLVLLDTAVPGRDSIEILIVLKSKYEFRDIPVVMLFDTYDEKQVRKALKLGAAEHLIKPINLNKLHEIIGTYLFRTLPRRRKHLRCPFEGMAKVALKDMLLELPAVTLSEGGIYLKQEPPIPVGTNLSVTVTLDKRDITFDGTVVYKNDGTVAGLDLPVGMAIEFQYATPEDFEALSAFVRRELERSE